MPLRVRAFGRYEGRLREAVHALKYHHKLALSWPLGAVLAEVVRLDPVLSTADAVVPVPLHPRRQAERGYNQAEEIGRELARVLEKPLLRALVRVRDTPSQTDLDEDERKRNVRGAFRACRNVRGLRLLLVDDVVTTGSTLAECARTLRSEGAEDVYATAVAMAVPEGLRSSLSP